MNIYFSAIDLAHANHSIHISSSIYSQLLLSPLTIPSNVSQICHCIYSIVLRKVIFLSISSACCSFVEVFFATFDRFFLYFSSLSGLRFLLRYSLIIL